MYLIEDIEFLRFGLRTEPKMVKWDVRDFLGPVATLDEREGSLLVLLLLLELLLFTSPGELELLEDSVRERVISRVQNSRALITWVINLSKTARISWVESAAETCEQEDTQLVISTDK